MTPTEIKESGILELYALGEISDENRAIVEKALLNNAEIRDELSRIEKSLEAFAQISGVKPSAGFKEKLLDQLADKTVGKSETASVKKSGGNKAWMGISALLFSLLLGSLIYSLIKSNKYTDLNENLEQRDKALAECDSLLQQSKLALNLLEDLRSSNSTLYTFTATPNFAETDIAIFNNKSNKTNYLKINELPKITDDLSYQLWSLKDGQDPIPLTVFNNTSGIIPLDFEQGTGTYAITIEKRGGAVSPNLENLIGTAKVG